MLCQLYMPTRRWTHRSPLIFSFWWMKARERKAQNLPRQWSRHPERVGCQYSRSQEPCSPGACVAGVVTREVCSPVLCSDTAPVFFSLCFCNSVPRVSPFVLNVLGWHWLTALYRVRCTALKHVACALCCVFATWLSLRPASPLRGPEQHFLSVSLVPSLTLTV